MKNFKILVTLSLLILVLAMTTGAGASTVPSVNSIIINPNQPYQTTIWTDKNDYSIGEAIGIGFKVNKDSYAYIFSIDADGVVRMLFPNIYSNQNWVKANVSYRLPDNDRYNLTIGGPKGTDQLVLISTPEKIQDTDWLARSLSNNNFAPQININFSADGFMAQIKSVVITPTFQSNWSSAYAKYTIGGVNSLIEPPSVNSIIITPPIIVPPVTNNGSLYITSSPSGARVFLNGYDMGTTPIRVTDLHYGQYEIIIILSGYYSYTSRVSVNNPNLLYVNGSLSRITGTY
jgi:hypothetical protein